MTASLSTISGKDGGGSTIVGGIQALDLSGAGTGPWSFANVIVDGTSGTNRAIVDSSGRLSVLVAATVPTILAVAAASGAPAAVAIKASAGTIKDVSLYCNNNSIPIFFKLYNVAAGSVTVGTTVPVAVIGVPPGSYRDVPFGDGGAFSTAISYAITGGIADNDATAVAVNDLKGFVTYV